MQAGPIAPKSTAFAWFRAVLCLSTATMMAVSWPLWVSAGSFPRVPFLSWVRLLPLWASWVRFGVTLAAMVAASAGFRWRSALGVAAAMSAWMVIEDQFRLQPWMYQFLLMGFALAACPPEKGRGLGRLFLIALYFHSALSKMDVGFVNENGREFLSQLGRPLGRWGPASWSEDARSLAAMAMPAGEMAVAFALFYRPTRRLGVAGAVLMHVTLIGILGPWGLRHSTIVLIWNAALILEVVASFASSPIAAEPPSAGRYPLASTASILVILAAFLPFGERWGLWDTWPSFGLYASHNERMWLVHEGGGPVDGYPPAIQAQFQRCIDGTRRYQRLHINEWSLDERGVPTYPQGRAMNGVAEALLSRYGDPPGWIVEQIGRADRRSGIRRTRTLRGLAEVRRHGDGFLVNAHPAR